MTNEPKQLPEEELAPFGREADGSPTAPHGFKAKKGPNGELIPRLRPGGARPKPDAALKATRRFYATDAEWETITERAAEAGLTVSEYVLRRALGRR